MAPPASARHCPPAATPTGDGAEPLLQQWGSRSDSDGAIYASLARSRAVFYTPTTTSTLRQIDKDLDVLINRVDICIDQHVRREQTHLTGGTPHYVDLLVVDEADRLSPPALEHLRDRFDRRPLGLLLIGMPGIDKRRVEVAAPIKVVGEHAVTVRLHPEVSATLRLEVVPA